MRRERTSERRNLAPIELCAQLVFCDLSMPDPGHFNVYDCMRSKLAADWLTMSTKNGTVPYESWSQAPAGTLLPLR